MCVCVYVCPSHFSSSFLRYRTPRQSRIAAMSGHWNPTTGAYTPSQDEVAAGMVVWDMAPGQQNAVFAWIKYLWESRWFASAVYFQYAWNGVPGVFLCVSTPASTRQSKQNGMANGGVDFPEYFLFDVYFYANLVFGHYHGFRDGDALHLGTLMDVLQSLCSDVGIATWRQHAVVRPGGWIYAGLRMLFEYLRVPIFAEVVSGLSYRRFASLDVYVAMYTSAMGMQPQPMVVWNAAYEDNRFIQYPIQDQWWSMPVWRSTCQLGLNLLDYQVGGIPAPVQATVQGVLTDLALQSL